MGAIDPAHYQTVAAGQAAQALGFPTGKAGDYLECLICVVATAATSAVSITDGAGASISVLPNAVNAVGTYQIWFTVASKAGPWKVTTGAGVSVIAIGTFA